VSYRRYKLLINYSFLHLYNGKFDILLITETWLHDDIISGLLDPMVCFIYCVKIVITLVAEVFVHLSGKI